MSVTLNVKTRLLCFLNSTLPGTKKLCVPKTSSSFVWDAGQVLSTCVRDTLYIMSKVEPLHSLFKNDKTVIITQR